MQDLLKVITYNPKLFGVHGRNMAFTGEDWYTLCKKHKNTRNVCVSLIL